MAHAVIPEEVAEETQPEPSKPRRSVFSKLLLLLLILGPLGGGGYFVVSKRVQAAAAAAEAGPPPLEEVTFPLQVQTVNLADGDRYARCLAVLAFRLDPVDAAYFRSWVKEYTEDKKPAAEPVASPGAKPAKKEPGDGVKDLLFRLANYQLQLHDALIRELSSRRYKELLSEADKDRVCEALKKRFESVLNGGDPGATATTPMGSGAKGESEQEHVPIERIYFSEFVMQ